MRIFLVVLVVGVAMGQRAEACSCSDTTFFARGPGVPLNVRLPVLGPMTTDPGFVLTTVVDGAIVPTTTQVVPGGFFVVPDAPLLRNTDYVLSPDLGQRSGQGFRTGESTQEVAPAEAPSLDSFTRTVVGRSTCGEPGEVLIASVGGALGEIHEVFVGPTTASIDTSAPAFVVRARSSLYLGDGVGICDARFLTGSRPDLAIALRTRDLAGNVSPLSNAIQLKTGGCSSTSGPTLLLLVALLTGVRRKWGQAAFARA